jgi:hypothetical protein
VSEQHSATEAEIAAALAAVREGVRSRPPSRGLTPEQARATRLAAREQAERYWAVTADRPFSRSPGARGRLRAFAVAPLKVIARRLVRWYVEPAITEQRHFNSAIVQLVDDLDERTAALEAGRAGRDAGGDATA